MEPDEPAMIDLSQLLSCTHDALVATDENFNITYWNSTAEELFGRSEKEALGRSIEDIIKIAETTPPPGVGQKTDTYAEWQNIRELLIKQHFCNKIAACHGREGGLILTDIRAKACTSANNDFQGAVFCFLDVTKARKSEEALFTHIECYRALFDMIYEGFCILEIVRNQSGKPVDIRVLVANVAYGKLTGKTAGDMIGGFLQSSLEHYMQIYNSLDLGNGPTHFEYMSKNTNCYFDVCVYLIDNSDKNIVGVLFKDISERKQNEKLLRQFSERLAAAMDTAHLAYWDWDPATDRTIVSDNVAAVFGLRSGDTLCCSDDYLKLIHPDDKTRYYATASHAVDTEENWHCEFRIIRPLDGKVAWLEERASAKRDPDTGKIHHSAIVWDITERKNYELALLKAKEQSELDRKRLESILRVMPSGIILFNANDMKISYMNRRAVELYGFNSTGQELETHIRRLKIRKLDGTPCPREEIPIYHSLAFGREARNKELLVERPDGSQLPIVASSAPLFDSEGKISSVLVIFDDITERKRTQLALQESESRYHSLFSSMSEGLCVMEMIFDRHRKPVDIRFIHVNPAFEKLTGVKNAVGRLVSSIYPKLESYWLETLGKVALTGEPVQYVNEAKGTGRWFRINAFKVQTNGLETVAVLLNDVTCEIKARNEMQELIKIQDEVFANVSHELKTPLSVIFSTVQLLELYMQRGTLDANRPSVCKSIRTIRQNCYRFTKLINNIVDLSRIDSGFFKLHLSNENIVDIVESIVKSIAEYIRDKGLSVVFDTNVEEKIIACDPGKIERILLNLISNAIKFSNPKGTISVFVSDLGDQVEIAVQDTGIGIEEKYLNSIFERFSQVDKTLTRNAEGSGIGLSLVKSIVNLHGGSISVESEVGKGSIFRVRLPVRTVEQPKAPIQEMPSLNKVERINIEFSDIYHL